MPGPQSAVLSSWLILFSRLGGKLLGVNILCSSEASVLKAGREEVSPITRR